jgi:hypothetical protein
MAGAMVMPATTSATNQSRADGRRSYLDPVLDRPNLHLAVQQTVTRIHLQSIDAPGVIGSSFGTLKRAHSVEVRPAEAVK